MENTRESNIYILFKSIGGENYFKVGKASDVRQRVSILNKTWGLFEEGSVSINLKNDHFKLEKNFGLHMEKIILRGLCVFGYDAMVSEEHYMKDGYKEFFVCKEGENKLDVVMNVLSILEPYKKTTKVETRPLKQFNFANLNKEVNLSKITPQQISLVHIEYFFEMHSKGLLENWKDELNQISAHETEWKKKHGFDTRANIKSGNKHEDKKLFWELKNRLEEHQAAEKSQNIRTVGYIQTFVKAVLKLFNKELGKINFEAFKNLLTRMTQRTPLYEAYNVLSGTKSLSEKTARRRKLSVQDWIRREFNLQEASAA